LFFSKLKFVLTKGRDEAIPYTIFVIARSGATKQSSSFRRVIASADASARSNPKDKFFRQRRLLRKN